MNIRDKPKKTNVAWFFLIAVLVMYGVLAFVNMQLFTSSLTFFFNLVIKLIPIFIIILGLMIVTNYFITPQLIMKYFNAPGVKKWFFVVVAGILSTGPIYMWYPLLADLRDKGVKHGFIATFLYSRAIKIWLLPVIVFYFNIQYVIVLTLVMIVFSCIQGITINRILAS
jgi:uncharacterized membrane protein YraQ (UPF0718 family)